MASVLPDPRQKRAFMASVPLQLTRKRDFMTSGDNRGQKRVPFGLAPICLGSKIEAESRK